MQTKTITIIGLRRSGLSIALALREATADFHLVGHDSETSRAQAAQKQGAIDIAERNLVNAATVGDIVVLTMPDSELRRTLQAIGPALQSHALVVDLSLLKGPGIEWARKYLPEGHYIGARPIFAASAFSGTAGAPEQARADLFANSVFCVMPSAEADPKAVETAVNFGRLLGATPYFVDPLEYDGLAQGVETLPGLLAAALFATVHKSTGWRDILRFADLRFALMTEPLEQDPASLAQLAVGDRAATLRWLDALVTELHLLRERVEEGEIDVLAALLEELSAERGSWLQERSQNEWTEVTTPDIGSISFSQQMLGSLGQRLGRKEKDRK